MRGYKFRSLPCTVVPEEQLWHVSGNICNDSGGVLEWCVGEADAHERLKIMQQYEEFSNLTCEKYLKEVSTQAEWNARRRGEVLRSLCSAIRAGRERNTDWSFPSDCFCPDADDRMSFQYDKIFLEDLCKAIELYVAKYRHVWVRREA